MISLLGDPRWQPAVSVAQVLEYESVAKREVPSLGLEPRVIDAILDMICAVSGHRTMHLRLRPTLPDPDDEFVLELAVASRSGFVVTHNIRDFAGAERFGVRVVSPAEFLRIIEREP